MTTARPVTDRVQSHGSMIESRTHEQQLTRVLAARPRPTDEAVDALLRELAAIGLVVSGADGTRIVERILVAQIRALASQDLNQGPTP